MGLSGRHTRGKSKRQNIGIIDKSVQLNGEDFAFPEDIKGSVKFYLKFQRSEDTS